ncbi:unnamed protein product [Amoebophrya sp. A120]|nr:unnamed protein product [Amoebophrya sp. A120]|eukprot:GSA120T00026425001.1
MRNKVRNKHKNAFLRYRKAASALFCPKSLHISTTRSRRPRNHPT